MVALSLLPLLLLACAEQNFSGGIESQKGEAKAANVDPVSEPEAPPVETFIEPEAPRVEKVAEVAAPAVEPVVVKDEEPEVEPVVVADEDKSIEFGSDEVFRIGNGQAVASSCLSEIDSFDLSGTTFFFEFEVLNDATTVNLAIGRLCGIDTKNNFVSLVDSNGKAVLGEKVIPQKVVADLGSAFSPFTQQKLNKGTYTIVMKSKPSGFLGDSDDFIVGKINVKADNAVRAVQVFAE